MNPNRAAPQDGRLVYCRCAHAPVVGEEVRNEILAALAASPRPFEAVADLCELSARRDPVLAEWADAENLTIVACFPRAVRWLFAAADAPLDPRRASILNMRTQGAADILAALGLDAAGREPAP
jgi:hypothetical protein